MPPAAADGVEDVVSGGLMAKQKGITVEGVVVEALPNAMFRVELDVS